MRRLTPMLLALAPAAVCAQPAAQFYADRTITILVGSEAGSGGPGRGLGSRLRGRRRFGTDTAVAGSTDPDLHVKPPGTVSA